MTTAVQIQLAAATLMFAVAPWVINAAPHEATMGLVYKIYFFHMPSAWMFMLAAIVSGVASARFLFTKNPKSDATAVAAAELAVLFGLLTLVSGPLWARKAWGVWWVWDARLTSSLMLFLIFVAYLLLRQFGGGHGRGVELQVLREQEARARHAGHNRPQHEHPGRGHVKEVDLVDEAHGGLVRGRVDHPRRHREHQRGYCQLYLYRRRHVATPPAVRLPARLPPALSPS